MATVSLPPLLFQDACRGASPDVPQRMVADRGRLEINSAYQSSLERLGLTSFAAFEGLAGTTVRSIDSRATSRVKLESLVIYLKRHGRPHWRERIVPWLRLGKRLLGASPEWNAIWRFHQLGIPTVEPVAFGRRRGATFVATRELVARCDLKQWVQECLNRRDPDGAWQAADFRQAIAHAQQLATMVATLHRGGLHHQDLYLNHVLWVGELADGRPDLRLIDLGRVSRLGLFRRRWIWKDLAQLAYSAAGVPRSVQLRFLLAYLGRRLNRSDRRWLGWIAWKAERIDRHTRKHRL
jgi:heptose I phosphotransferase